MSVVGFDIGNENCVIAVVKQRGVDVLLNDESKRETPAVVCFGEKQRFLGSAGAASAMMNPKSTVSQVKRLIGRKFSEPDVQRDLRMLPFQTSEAPDGGILIHLKYLGETHTFTTGSDLQRRAYLDAATVAGLKPLRLMHDCTATALSYGIYKTDFPSSGPTYVAFVDIGHCDTQVTIASFEAGQMKILSHTFERSLGEFKEQYRIDVYSNVKASIRLRAACEKLKKVLSANAEAPLNIECLMDEKDVKGFIKREDFETLSSGLLERIGVPCSKALADAGLTAEKIHSVELVGSGSRIPAVGRVLTSVFRKEPRRTLNASECVARGCALQCAMLSPVFRVREYEVQDSIPFSIGFLLDEAPICTGSNGILFPKGQPIPSVKVLTFRRSSSFHLEAFYANPSEVPAGVSSKISCFKIGPFQCSHSEKARVKVKIQLDLNGVVFVESAMVIEEHGDDSSTKGVADSMDPMDIDCVTASGSSEAVADGFQESSSMQSKSSHASGDGKRDNKSTRRLEIPVTENIYGGMTKAELSEAQEKELQLGQQDRIMEQTKDKKNALESYVYDMRNKLFNTYRSFASDEEREGISRSLQQTEDWLYDDGEDETENAYTSKLEDLKKMVDPIENRYKDEEARLQATRDLLKCIGDYRMAVNSLPPMDRESIVNECYKVEQWLREKNQLQDSLPKNVDPVLWSSDIKSRAEELNS
ncbi:hypothetical protein GBA52_014114 [Prunus armeniaca]|nr:hypothetical protein GBA52_014114 [Prunus armeniaca]